MYVALARLVNGDTDSTEGPGMSLRLEFRVGPEYFGFPVAEDDGLAALDWTLHRLSHQDEPGKPAFLECLRYGEGKSADSSHLWRGRVFDMLNLYASNLVSEPG
jgi:hypothetical protein